MPNNYLSVLYKHIIQVENEKVGAQTYHCPPIKMGAHSPLALPASYASEYGRPLRENGKNHETKY